ncbi:hypothetical protein RJ640_011023 [Escallonia rubra]|uniref:mannose-6-phosphate isomerase n=1 Tax=Escallonia rubra TaxID=112253 RepID=A0AA88RJX8_9ASTE|nr:hypothetical protein RJ640_011023 [Escallonia rubra]
MEVGGGLGKKERRLVRLRCSVKNYDWGRMGSESRVARMHSLNSGVGVVEDKPYAEFWMGTHESGPSFMVRSAENGAATGLEGGSVSLNSWIAQNPDVLGDKVVKKWGHNLPFLFKVLSVAKGLSIQAHPDKELAEVLHKLQPNVYKDDNHKPEMVLALTEFEALCGFIRLEVAYMWRFLFQFNFAVPTDSCMREEWMELKGVLQNVPEILEVIGSAYANQVLHFNEQDGEEKAKAVLRSIFTQLMSASNSREVISKALSKLISRLTMEKKVRELTDKEELVLQLEKQYPDDVGVIAAFLFNHVKLNAGEALYLGANELHAYIYGECVECMATSDNVVRAGLTPKNRDVKILCSMLTYKQGFPEILKGVPLNPYISRYIPPFDEFEVDRCILRLGASVVFPAVPGPSIFVVMMGQGRMQTSSHEDLVKEGDVLFAPASAEISVTSTASELHLYRAGVNTRFFSAS